MGLYDYNLYDVIKRNARINGDGIAVKFAGMNVSHREFLGNVDRLASGLSAAGIEIGDRIGVIAKNNPEFLYIYGAAAKLGAIVLPVNWRLNPDEVEHIIFDCSPKLLIIEPEFRETALSLMDKAAFLNTCFCVGETEAPVKPFEDLMGDAAVPQADVADESGCVIIHTAAVHGKPRGATLTHRGLMLASGQMMSTMGATKEDSNLAVLPLFHIAGLEMAAAAMLACGTNIVLPGFDADQSVKHIAEDNAGMLCVFPPILKTIMEKAEETGIDVSNLKNVCGIDLPETIEKSQAATGGTFWVGYGQSETSGLMCLAPYSDKPGSAGVPFEFVNLEIIDEFGQIVPPGQSGEIVVRGPLVFQGYWNLEADNAHTFRDGWHHTGDKGRLDEDGYVWFEGRAEEKELIKPGGENVYPAEVEAVILEHPDVKEAIVIGVPDSHWGEAIKAVCILNEGASISEAELIDFVAGKIARFKKPKHVVFVPDLPRNEDGSIDRKAVKEAHG
jgi:acyl-CoA synthetase (AMP-forming)/AMP-acid ligase II